MSNSSYSYHPLEDNDDSDSDSSTMPQAGTSYMYMYMPINKSMYIYKKINDKNTYCTLINMNFKSPAHATCVIVIVTQHNM